VKDFQIIYIYRKKKKNHPTRKYGVQLQLINISNQLIKAVLCTELLLILLASFSIKLTKLPSNFYFSALNCY
jgi:hypothetical protein